MYLANGAIESPTHTSIVLYSIILVGLYIPRECLLTYCTLDGKRCVPSYHLYPLFYTYYPAPTHSVAEWLACWTQAQKGPG